MTRADVFIIGDWRPMNSIPLDNPWFQNIAAEVIGVLLGLAVGFLSGWLTGRRRKVRAFYKSIRPVLESIRSLRIAGRLDPEGAREIVRQISSNFSDAFLDGPDPLRIKKEVVRPAGTIMACGVCALEAVISDDLCPNCKLDCCAWDSFGSTVIVPVDTLKRKGA